MGKYGVYYVLCEFKGVLEILIDHIRSKDYRLVSPVGGGSIDLYKARRKEKSKSEIEFQVDYYNFLVEEYGYAFLESGISYSNLCKLFGFNTYIEKSGFENVYPGQLKDLSDLEKLKKCNYKKYIVESDEVEVVRRYYSKYSKGFIGGGTFGPVTITGILLGINNFLKGLIRNPKFISECIKFFSEVIYTMALVYEKAGAKFFTIGDPTAVMLSPNQFWEFSGKYMKSIFSSISIPGFIHIPGDTSHLIENFIKTQAQCLSIDSHVDTKKLMYTVPNDIVVLGNINTVDLLKLSREEIEIQVRDLNTTVLNFENYVISSGGGVIEGTKDENIRAIFDITREFETWSSEEYSIIRRIWRNLDRNNYDKILNYCRNNNYQTELIDSAFEEYFTMLKQDFKKNKIKIKKVKEFYNEI